jgi:hypothetical protein
MTLTNIEAEDAVNKHIGYPLKLGSGFGQWQLTTVIYQIHQ